MALATLKASSALPVSLRANLAPPTPSLPLQTPAQTAHSVSRREAQARPTRANVLRLVRLVPSLQPASDRASRALATFTNQTEVRPLASSARSNVSQRKKEVTN